MIQFRPYQETAIQSARDKIAGGCKRILLNSPTGSGKCLGKGTPVLMYNGTIKSVEDVRPGDQLMGPDSAPRQVLTICQGKEMLYRVTPIKGDAYIVNQSHILSLMKTHETECKVRGQRDRGGEIVNISVIDYLASSKWFKHVHKGWRAAVDFQPARESLLIDPYFLGMWLGDGSQRGTGVTTGDWEVIDFLKKYARELGLSLRIADNSENSICAYITLGYRGGNASSRGNQLINALDYHGLRQCKHIPLIYKTSSRDDRLKLLAGYLDADGSLWLGGYDVISKSEVLIDDIIFVARSLGFSAYKTTSRKTCGNNGKTGDYWRCQISGETSTIPCLIARKQAQKRQQKKNPRVTGIKSVDPIGVGDYYGFEIDGDRLFMLGDFTVTHNTVIAAGIVQRAVAKGKRVLFLAHRRELIHQTCAKLVEGGVLNFGVIMAGHRINHAAAPVQVASIQTLVRRELPQADIIIVDEAHRITSRSYLSVLANYPLAVVLGLSATPERLDGRGLDDVFNDMVVVAKVPDLIDQGFLVRPVCYVGPTADLSGIKIKRGDYDETALAEAMDRPSLTGNIVTNWLRLANGKKTVAFAASVDHAKHIADEFMAAGVSAAWLSGDTPTAQREALIADWRAGYITVIANCMIFCLDSETEILTDRGFVRHEEMTMQHKVANWCPDGTIYFNEPEDIVKRELYDFEKMAVVNTGKVDIRVTDTHRMIYKVGRGLKWEKTAARNLAERCFTFPVCGNAEPVVFDDLHRKRWLATSRARFVSTNSYNYRVRNGLSYPESIIEAERLYDIKSGLVSKLPHELTIDECHFIGFWIGDGSINHLMRGGVEYTASQSAIYPEIINWFDSVIEKIGIDCIKRKKSAPKHQKTQNDWLCWSFPRGTGGRNQDRNGIFFIEPYLDKNGSYLLNGLNREQILALIHGLWMADGDHTIHQRRVIANTNKGLLDLLQSILVCRGSSATVNNITPPGYKDHWKPIYLMTFDPNKAIREVSSTDPEKRMRLEEPIEGERVWCVKTESRNLVTRRNGRICVMGNTEGFDLPELEVCILARPTQSVGMYLQQAGRIMRPSPDKTQAIIIDHAGCCQMHGQPHLHREWTLEGMAKKRKDQGQALHQVCQPCGMVFEAEPTLWLEETQPALRPAFVPAAQRLLAGSEKGRGMATCPGCSAASCLVCGGHFEVHKTKQAIDGIATSNIAVCATCAARYSDVPQLMPADHEAYIPTTTQDDLVAMGDEVPIKVTVLNDYKRLINEAKRHGRKRGWAYWRLKEKYDDGVLRDCLPRHTGQWWKEQAR